MWKKVIVWALVLLLAAASAVSSFGITIEKSAYRDVVVEIQDTVPMDQCAQVLNDLEVSFVSIFLSALWFCERSSTIEASDILNVVGGC